MDIRDIHTPVLLERCAELLGPALQKPEPSSSTARSAWAATPRRSSSASRTPGSSAWTATPTPSASRGSASRASAIASPSCTPSTTASPTRPSRLASVSTRSTASVRPRRVVAAARRGRPRLRLRAGRAPRHAHGSDDRITAAEVLATYGEGDLRRIFERYGEEKLAGRYARPSSRARPGAAGAVRSARRRAAGRHPRRCVAARTPPRQARVPGPAHRGQRRTVGARAHHPRGPRRPRRRRTHRGAVVPVARRPPRQARVRRGLGIHRSAWSARRTARARAEVPGCSCAEPNWRATTSAPQPRATPVRLRAAERIQEDA